MGSTSSASIRTSERRSGRKFKQPHVTLTKAEKAHIEKIAPGTRWKKQMHAAIESHKNAKKRARRKINEGACMENYDFGLTEAELNDLAEANGIEQA